MLGGLVLVDGAPVANPKAFVRADSALKVLRPKPLRGTLKLAYAIESFGLELTGLVAVDLGAAAGGFTQALLDAGTNRVYAVDAGVGQLLGSLRADPRVVNLERTNLAALDQRVVPEPVEVVVMDLSYLAISAALGQLGGLCLANGPCSSRWSSRPSSFTAASLPSGPTRSQPRWHERRSRSAAMVGTLPGRWLRR